MRQRTEDNVSLLSEKRYGTEDVMGSEHDLGVLSIPFETQGRLCYPTLWQRGYTNNTVVDNLLVVLVRFMLDLCEAGAAFVHGEAPFKRCDAEGFVQRAKPDVVAFANVEATIEYLKLDAVTGAPVDFLRNALIDDFPVRLVAAPLITIGRV